MFHRADAIGTGPSSVRDLPLLEGERMEERFVPYDGLVPEDPQKGELLVLTNKRVISFLSSNGGRETQLAPLKELNGVSVKGTNRGLKNLSYGLILVVAGVLTYFIVGYKLDGVAVAAALGAAIIFVGALFIARYFFWEEEGIISFQGSSWELSFPYRSNMASACVYSLVNRFFQLKLNGTNHRPPPGAGPSIESDDSPPPSPPSQFPYYDI